MKLETWKSAALNLPRVTQAQSGQVELVPCNDQAFGAVLGAFSLRNQQKSTFSSYFMNMPPVLGPSIESPALLAFYHTVLV